MTTLLTSGRYPTTRLRRLRGHPWLRDIVAETSLSAKDLIWPIFIREEEAEAEIPAMTGVKRLTLAELAPAVQKAYDLGIPAVALFPMVSQSRKSAGGEEAFNPDNLICRSLQIIKTTCPHMGTITDVALDPYTTHGHDGILVAEDIHNEKTLEVLCQQALIQAKAGADILAPSDMMDGRVGAIRKTLDQHHLIGKSIMSYAAKYASAFYGPFRQAIGSARLQGKSDKKTYQMDPANSDEALREIAFDLDEGADMIIIKPGLPYLDIIRRAVDTFLVPTFAYQVSGEYAMIQAASAQGWLDKDRVMMESLIALKRAGSSGIFTYAAVEIAEKLASA